MLKVLSFDASTTTIGISVIFCNDDFTSPALLHYAYYKPQKTGNIFSRLTQTKKDIKDVIETSKPDLIFIEEYASFMPGKSNAGTIISLAILNRTVGLVCYDYNDLPPLMLNVMSIRHGLKLNKTLPSKEEMPELVEKILGFKFNYVYDKDNVLIAETFDQADAIAVGLFGIKYLNKLQNSIAALKEKISIQTEKKKIRKYRKQLKELVFEFEEHTGIKVQNEISK
jgi:Holliday junction resolvasome RuvABC endonuclease subunit